MLMMQPPPLATVGNAGIPASKRKAFDSSAAKGHAAGVLFVAPDGDVLLCRRSTEEKNFGGHWALPGGGVEDGETPVEGATREVREELGHDASEGRWKVLDQTMTPTGMAFHTFAVPVDKKFHPTLNDEHLGASWFPLDHLPSPMHPAVAGTLKERIGIGEDMTPEDWEGLRKGLAKWISEEEAEPEHQMDANDSVYGMALDRAASVRSFDQDGRMHVAVANISKAQIRPYLGKEIPGWDDETKTHALGLDPKKTYKMLCPPEELEKAAATFNGIQFLKDHKPVDVGEPRKRDLIGCLGTGAVYNHPYLQNSLHVWTQDGIDFIESQERRELSCGYHYEPDMTPGAYEGEAYDGVIRNMRGNHVTICEEGRAGPDVLVGDSRLELEWAVIEDALQKMLDAA